MRADGAADVGITVTRTISTAPNVIVTCLAMTGKRVTGKPVRAEQARQVVVQTRELASKPMI